MVAPRAETLRTFGRDRKVVGIILYCPECPLILGSPLRVEEVKDYPKPWFPIPDLVGNAGPLGFIARCDACGFRVEMHGTRLATVQMLQVAAAEMSPSDIDDDGGSPYGHVGPDHDVSAPSANGTGTP